MLEDSYFLNTFWQQKRGADIQKFLGRYPVSFYVDKRFFTTGTVF